MPSSKVFISEPGKQTNTRCLIIIFIIGIIVAFVIGILIGRFATCPEDEPEEVPNGLYLPDVSKLLVQDGDPGIGDEMINNINTENIRQNLRMLTDKPHLAGTEGNHELARKLKEHWENVGLDQTTLTPYNVMLSYPNMSDLNYVEIIDENNDTIYKSNLREPALTPEENKTGIVPPFNAYSAPGDIYGDLVYVNYGRVEDFEYLEKNKSINVTGKIVFARYGKIFRGNKVKEAEKRGAIGVILFSDPDDVTDGDITNVYPHDWWLPESGTQRGVIYFGSGDHLTPGYPATETAYRELPDDMPTIPCHPIGYGIAIHLMRELVGEEVPEDWRGGMNVTYRFGNGFKAPKWRAHIKVTTSNKNVTTYNAIGIIRGSIEPDRYVIIGNHRDAWVFGALDPSSGTAIMMEVSRVMGQLVKSGRWRPRRSIIFCSWGAEEYGLIGSTEWVEHYVKNLGARAIGYINVDVAVWGNHSLTAEGTPPLYSSLIKATKKVQNPNSAEIAAGRTTVYDTWYHVSPSPKFERPRITLPGSGSDYAPFRDRLGLPVVDVRFTHSPKLKVSIYPMYHTAYETFYLVDKIMDRGFKYHTAIGQILSELARDLADSLILPFNLSDYSAVMKDLGSTLVTNYGKQMNDNGLDTSLLNDAIDNFTKAVDEFEDRMKTVNLKDPFVTRRINDQLMQLDRAFLDPAGLPGRQFKRQILFAESSADAYSGSSFPGIVDALSEINLGRDIDKQWKIARQHFSVVLFTIQSASSTLMDVTNFMYSY
ncbi:N-acetylated-alpha-linked acidic dipeptidase 2-like isoform X2 [Mercenaria mercenaria]|uniref:N-acetylated-alpha-linked acidic dipeptidase 2-like isoform X2 n=1 Tax=Mercenaria mercenaria TaxID=6596 RepID=UPI001E1E18F8|nr:N-acetylated-alpha-linked acidic dipeptidase 2-like isoform X2 [Mercenaria mercenaria]XP_053400843.1 N-acetylated-alpha-linked acidic dipeptidase 2-like isoform X2 [Mercenaria mercenaria]XP_053400848.1 N-acetylated-alpha-linked acidic dipeptidase 2-like isoform X2 [Mercenaria mercenaria]